MADKELPNLLVLVPIRVQGEHREVGSVIPKSLFGEKKGDWQDMTVMEPPRLMETDAKVGDAPKGDKAALPGIPK